MEFRLWLVPIGQTPAMPAFTGQVSEGKCRTFVKNYELVTGPRSRASLHQKPISAMTAGANRTPPLSYTFYGVSTAGVSCRRRWPQPTTPALTTLLG